MMPLSTCHSCLLLVILTCSMVVSGQHLSAVPQNLTVLEEQRRGSLIGQISVPSAVPPYTVYHADRRDTGTILVSGTGRVTVGHRIDREQKSLYRLIAHSSNNINIEVMITVSLPQSVMIN